MKFTVYGTPRPQGSTRAFIPKGWNRAVITSDNKKLKPWRQEVTDTLFVESGCIPYSGSGNEAIVMSLDFFFKRPKSAPKSRAYPTVKPDVDKLIRAIFDAGTGVLYGDDAQLVGVTARKHYDAIERVEIEVIEL